MLNARRPGYLPQDQIPSYGFVWLVSVVAIYWLDGLRRLLGDQVVDLDMHAGARVPLALLSPQRELLRHNLFDRRYSLDQRQKLAERRGGQERNLRQASLLRRPSHCPPYHPE